MDGGDSSGEAGPCHAKQQVASIPKRSRAAVQTIEPYIFVAFEAPPSEQAHLSVNQQRSEDNAWSAFASF